MLVHVRAIMQIHWNQRGNLLHKWSIDLLKFHIKIKYHRRFQFKPNFDLIIIFFNHYINEAELSFFLVLMLLIFPSLWKQNIGTYNLYAKSKAPYKKYHSYSSFFCCWVSIVCWQSTANYDFNFCVDKNCNSSQLWNYLIIL